MVLEMGVSAQPLQQSYSEYSDWVTHSWFNSLWEKLDLLNVLVEFHDPPVKMGRDRDKWLMLELKLLGLAKTGTEMAIQSQNPLQSSVPVRHPGSLGQAPQQEVPDSQGPC